MQCAPRTDYVSFKHTQHKRECTMDVFAIHLGSHSLSILRMSARVEVKRSYFLMYFMWYDTGGDCLNFSTFATRLPQNVRSSQGPVKYCLYFVGRIKSCISHATSSSSSFERLHIDFGSRMYSSESMTWQRSQPQTKLIK